MNQTKNTPAQPAKPDSRRATRWAEQRRHRRQLLRATAIAVAAVVALFAIYVASNGSKKASSPTAGEYSFAIGDPGPGQPAPPIVLASTDGGTFDLASFNGKTVLLYFQEGVGCQPCWDQMRDIETNRDKFAALGIDEFVTVTSNSLELISQKLAQDNIAGPVLADTDLAVSKTYDANSYGMMGGSTDGHTFILVNPDGVISWRADYGGEPDFTMFVPVPSLLADITAGLAASPPAR